MQTHNREEQRPCTNHPLGRTETDQGPSTGNKAVRPGRRGVPAKSYANNGSGAN